MINFGRRAILTSGGEGLVEGAGEDRRHVVRKKDA
jgi:hypothetical protein